MIVVTRCYFAARLLMMMAGPSDVLRQRTRCTCCGHKGATIQHPGCGGADIGFVPFPTIIEPIGRELRIPNRVLDALVSRCTEAGCHAGERVKCYMEDIYRCLLEWCWGRCRRGRPRGCYSFLEFLSSASRSIGMHLLLERTVDLPASIRRHKLNKRQS